MSIAVEVDSNPVFYYILSDKRKEDEEMCDDSKTYTNSSERH
jgi:hypothetical protein